MSKSVFFHRVNINEATGTAIIIASSKPLTVAKGEILGQKVATRSQQNVTFGLLSLVDPETGKTMDSKHPTIKALQAKLNRGDEIQGYQISENPVLDRETQEPTGLFWIEAV